MLSGNPGKVTDSDNSVGVTTNSANPEKIIDKMVGDDRNVGMSPSGNADNPGNLIAVIQLAFIY